MQAVYLPFLQKKNMYSMSILFNMILIIFLTNLLSIVHAVTYSDTHDNDAYGTRLISTDYFVVIARNDISRYVISMAPFGAQNMYVYPYPTTSTFVISIAVNRRQNSSQLSFVYLQTNSTDGHYLQLGLFTFSLGSTGGSSNSTPGPGTPPVGNASQVKVWEGDPPELSTLQVDLDGNYAYGFLSNLIFIYNIKNSSVQNFSLNNVFSSITFYPHALDIGATTNGYSMAIVAGYYEFDIGKSLPAVYLIRLNPPYQMTLVSNYTITSDDQKFVQGRYTSSYDFNYVMSVSIHDSTQQVLVAIPQLKRVYRFSFTNTNLTFVNVSNHPARSTAWLDKNGTQVGFILSDVSALPWAKSRTEVVDLLADKTLYVCPNNQQTLESWSNAPPIFLRLTVTYDYQLAILASDGTVVLISSAEAGYYRPMDDINGIKNNSQSCPSGTYKSIRGTSPCTICPTGTKSSTDASSNSVNTSSPTINCTVCLTNSFCPLASIKNVNLSSIQSISQAYPYPLSPSSTSFDDILIQNTFSLQSYPQRCLVISPFFWALMTLVIAFIILLIMGFLYHSPTQKKHFHRLEYIFRHSDLIGNGELWFGGLISFAIIILIIYGFWFGTAFANKYPIETSTDADFACDTTLRNAQFSSVLQLLSTIRSDEQKPIFNMLDNQNFTMTLHFIQTGYSCKDVTAQENIGAYSVSFTPPICIEQPNDARLTVKYTIPYHQISLQINLTGLYYIGGLYICLTGPSSVSNDLLYKVQEMNYCELFNTSSQTLGQTTSISFVLTKVINQTQSLDYGGATNYSGIWIPTAKHGALDDHVIYDQRGAFLRYLSTNHIIMIDFDETDFYVSNNQEPIARTGEVVFHNILFTTTVLGIFALAFLIFKLTFMPIITYGIKQQMCLGRLRKSKTNKTMPADLDTNFQNGSAYKLS